MTLTEICFIILVGNAVVEGNLARILSNAELVSRESTFEDKFFAKNVSIQFRINGLQFGPRQNEPWIFDNDTSFFVRKASGTGVFAPSQISLLLISRGDGTCRSKGSGIVSTISQIRSTGLSSLGVGNGLTLNFSEPTVGSAVLLGNMNFFRHINVDDNSKDWRVVASAGDQRTYSRGSDAKLYWQNGSIALSMRNLMWKEVVRYPNPPNSRNVQFEHSGYIEGDIDAQNSDLALMRLLDPDDLLKVFAAIDYKTPPSSLSCYTSNDVELSFFPVLKPFRIVSPSELWEKVLGTAVGICYSTLAGVLLLIFAICHVVIFNMSCSGEIVEVFGGTRRAFHSILLVAGLGEIFLVETDASLSMNVQLSWLLFRDSASQFGNMANVIGTSSTPISPGELTRVAISCSVLIVAPLVALGLVQFAPVKFRSIPTHWILILGDWGMFTGLLSALQMIVYHLTSEAAEKLTAIQILQVAVLLFLGIPIFLGFNFAVTIRAVMMKRQELLYYHEPDCDKSTGVDSSVGSVSKSRVQGHYTVHESRETFHKSCSPLYGIYRGEAIFFVLVDPILLATHGILLGAIRMSTLAAAIAVLVPTALKFLLFLVALPRRHASVDYLIVSVSLMETAVHGIGLATVFVLSVKWYYTAHIILLALMLPLLVALVWQSDWYFAFVAFRRLRESESESLDEFQSAAGAALSRVSETEEKSTEPTAASGQTTQWSFHTAANHFESSSDHDESI